MFEDNVLERDELALDGAESPQSVPASHEPSATSEKPDVTARAPSPHESPAAKRLPHPFSRKKGSRRPPAKQRRNGFLRRRPVVSAIGAMLLASVLGGGYLYLDYARAFSVHRRCLHRGAAVLARPESVRLSSPPSRSPTTSMSPPAT